MASDIDTRNVFIDASKWYQKYDEDPNEYVGINVKLLQVLEENVSETCVALSDPTGDYRFRIRGASMVLAPLARILFMASGIFLDEKVLIDRGNRPEKSDANHRQEGREELPQIVDNGSTEWGNELEELIDLIMVLLATNEIALLR
jgi:hypothetical protein